MLRKFAVLGLIVLAYWSPAMADPTAEAGGVAAAFGKALAACDEAGIEALYEDNATAIFPGQGEEAKGKAAIGKMAMGDCKDNGKEVSANATALGADYIVNVGRWEGKITGPDGKPTMVAVRTTEVLHKGSDGKWRYVVDHASVGVPRPPAGAEKASTP
jgi:ketosteroid isomerase-like protein